MQLRWSTGTQQQLGRRRAERLADNTPLAPSSHYARSVPVEKREQVFVSSTYLDLREERQAVIQTLLEADCIPAGMELFPASDEEKWELIKRVIDDSDYYVVVIGGRYGSVDDEGLSFTEKEFDYAASTKTPIMGFLHGDPGKIVADKIDLDPLLRQRLDDFRNKVSQRMVKFWTSPADLAGAVALSLIQTRKHSPAEGWVRAGQALTPEVEREIAQLREQVATLTKELDHARSTASHVVVDVEALAQGDDKYEMPIQVRYWSKEHTAEGTTYERFAQWHYSSIHVAWDTLFAALAPLLMDEASEARMDKELDSVAYINSPEPPPLPPEAGVWDKILATSDAVHEVKVQLFSLGLIRQSKKRHPVNDKNAYWTLTDEGRDHMMRLRAIRRPLPSAPEADEGAPDARS